MRWKSLILVSRWHYVNIATNLQEVFKEFKCRYALLLNTTVLKIVNHLEKGFSHWVGHEQLEAALDRESRGLQVKLGSQKRVPFAKAA